MKTHSSCGLPCERCEPVAELLCSEGAPTGKDDASSVGGTPPPPSGDAEKSKGVSSRGFALILRKVDPFSSVSGQLIYLSP